MPLNQKMQNEVAAAAARAIAARAVAAKKLAGIEEVDEGEALHSGKVDIWAINFWNGKELETLGSPKQPPKPQVGR